MALLSTSSRNVMGLRQVEMTCCFIGAVAVGGGEEARRRPFLFLFASFSFCELLWIAVDNVHKIEHPWRAPCGMGRRTLWDAPGKPFRHWSRAEAGGLVGACLEANEKAL